jgi:hypothetical protein
VFDDAAVIVPESEPIYSPCSQPRACTAQIKIKSRRISMKKLIAIVALAMAVISAPAFAHAATFEDATHGVGISTQS